MSLPDYIHLSEDKDGAILVLNTDNQKKMLIVPSAGNSFKIIFVNRREFEKTRIPVNLES